MASTSPGFAAPLLTQARADLAAEQERHAKRVALLESRIALLEATGTRSRRALLADPGTPDETVRVALADGPALRAAELRALMSRPLTAEWEKAVSDTFGDAVAATLSRGHERDDARMATLADVLLDTPAWSGARRVMILLRRSSPALLDHLLERAAAEPAVALLLARHLGTRTWGRFGTPAAVRHLAPALAARVPLWASLGQALEVGHLPVALDAELRERLLGLAPLEVAVRLAGAMPPRKRKGAAAYRERVEALEALLAGVVAQPAG